ncbi:MAG: sigma-70 family RNA polymerase sigma factor, partial [Mycobacterium sp.]
MNQLQAPTERVSEAWRRNRPYLVNLGYQIIGDIGDAEEVAQEAFLRLSRTGPNEIDDVRGWLTVVTTRLCLDQVRSARARYERPGEPADDGHAGHELMVDESRRVDPADRVTLDDEIRTALMEVLRRLSPAERVAFVLHDVFGVPF